MMEEGGLNPIPAVIARRRATHWTGCVPIKGLTNGERQPLDNLTACFWIVGGNLSPRKKRTQAQGEHANSTKKSHSWPLVGFKPMTF